MKQLAAEGAPEGLWLRADRQTGGRGRSGRAWSSPPGNLYASTLVRLRPGDPPPPTLALVAGVALYEAVLPYLRGRGALHLKWPNDLLVDTRKLAGILLERVDAAVVIGIGVNLAEHPSDTIRPATSIIGETGVAPPADALLPELARIMMMKLTIWRESLVAIRDAWLAAAHPIGTSLITSGSGAENITGGFDGLTPDGACRLRLADGQIRIIHAGDLFLG